MRILFIDGEGDYDAMAFEEKFPDIERVITEFFQEGTNGKVNITFGDEHEYNVTLSVKEFTDVDYNFILFMFDEFVDYDVTKSKNIHVLKEDAE